MRQKHVLIVAVSVIAFSCSNDAEQHSLQGNWSLTNAANSDGLNIDYSQGQVQWSFNENNHTLTVNNEIMTTGPEDIFSGLATGNYYYRIKKENNIDHLYVEGNEQGALSITGSNLVLNYSAVNNTGIVRVFRR